MKGYQGWRTFLRRAAIVLSTLACAALITALIFPRACGCGGRARDIECMSDAKQIGLGLVQYSQDNDEKLPPRQSVDAYGHLLSWRAALDGYLTYPKTNSTTAATYSSTYNRYRYSSAASLMAPIANPASSLDDIEHDGFKRSFAVNSTSGAGESTGPFADAIGGKLKVTDVDNPANVIAVVESTAAYNDFNPLFPQAFRRSTSRKTNGGHLFVHVDYSKPRTHVIYLDGHVKAIDPLRTLTSTNPWTIDNRPFTTADESTAKSLIEFGVDHSRERVN